MIDYLAIFIYFQFFGAMISTFGTNFLLGAFHGHPTKLSAPGLVRFNVFKEVNTKICFFS